jgi:hypothetical protein
MSKSSYVNFHVILLWLMLPRDHFAPRFLYQAGTYPLICAFLQSLLRFVIKQCVLYQWNCERNIKNVYCSVHYIDFVKIVHIFHDFRDGILYGNPLYLHATHIPRYATRKSQTALTYLNTKIDTKVEIRYKIFFISFENS